MVATGHEKQVTITCQYDCVDRAGNRSVVTASHVATWWTKQGEGQVFLCIGVPVQEHFSTLQQLVCLFANQPRVIRSARFKFIDFSGLGTEALQMQQRLKRLLLSCGLVGVSACSAEVEPLPRIGRDCRGRGWAAGCVSAKHADAVVNGKHIVTWASGEWLVLALRPATCRTPSSARTRRLRACWRWECSSRRRSVGKRCIRPSRRTGSEPPCSCSGKRRIAWTGTRWKKSARTLAVERGDASMQSLLSAALRGAGAGVAAQHPRP